MPFPADYVTWRRCIEIDCELVLSPAFLRDRIAALEDPRDFRTQQFIALYGPDHLAQVLEWFRRAARESLH